MIFFIFSLAFGAMMYIGGMSNMSQRALCSEKFVDCEETEEVCMDNYVECMGY